MPSHGLARKCRYGAKQNLTGSFWMLKSLQSRHNRATGLLQPTSMRGMRSLAFYQRAKLKKLVRHKNMCIVATHAYMLPR